MLRTLSPLTLAALFSAVVAIPGSAAAPEKLKLTARKVTEVEETVAVTDPAIPGKPHELPVANLTVVLRSLSPFAGA